MGEHSPCHPHRPADLNPALGSPNLRYTPGVKGPNLAFVGGTVIVAIMAVVVFIGAANAGDCPRSKSAEATSVEAHHNADDKADVEA